METMKQLHHELGIQSSKIGCLGITVTKPIPSSEHLSMRRTKGYERDTWAFINDISPAEGQLARYNLIRAMLKHCYLETK